MWKHLEQQRLHYTFSKLVDLVAAIGINNLEEQEAEILYRFHDAPLKDTHYCLNLEKFIAYLRNKYREIKVTKNEQKFFDKKELRITMASQKRIHRKHLQEQEVSDLSQSSQILMVRSRAKKLTRILGNQQKPEPADDQLHLKGCQKKLLVKPAPKQPVRTSRPASSIQTTLRPRERVLVQEPPEELTRLRNKPSIHVQSNKSISQSTNKREGVHFKAERSISKATFSSKRSLGLSLSKLDSEGRKLSRKGTHKQTMKKQTIPSMKGMQSVSVRGWVESQSSSVNWEIGNNNSQNHNKQTEVLAELKENITPEEESSKSVIVVDKCRKKWKILDSNFWVQPFKNKFLEQKEMRENGDVLAIREDSLFKNNLNPENRDLRESFAQSCNQSESSDRQGGSPKKSVRRWKKSRWFEVVQFAGRVETEEEESVDSVQQFEF